MNSGTEDTLAPDTEREDRLAEGAMFGPYRIVRLLGRGGMGAVHEAVHTGLNKRVAVKTLRREVAGDAHARQRFVREGQAASKLDHPHVVSVSDVGVEKGVPYLVMELMSGEDLGHLLDREKALSIERTVEIMVPVCVAVEAAHRAGIIHRDLKPDNIFLAKNALGHTVPKVLDFGISKLTDTPADHALTGSAALMGTSYYMSPEQAMGAKNVDARSDQYTLGVILYECVTGQRAFSGESLYEILYAINEGRYALPRTLRPDLPERFEAMILRAMRIPASERFPSCEALAQELLAFGDAKARMSWEPNLGTPPDAPIPSVPPERVSKVAPVALSRPDTLSDTAKEIDRLGVTGKVAARSRRFMTVGAIAAVMVGVIAVSLRAHNAAVPHVAATPTVIAAPRPAPIVAVPTPPAPQQTTAVVAPTAPSTAAPVASAPAIDRPAHASGHRHHARGSQGGCRQLPNGAFDCSGD